MPDLSLTQWSLLGLCAVSTGLAKTGMPGFGTLAVTLAALALHGDVQRSAGLLLPLLCFADLLGVWWFRRHAQVRSLWELLPWVLAGMVFGAAALLLDAVLLRRLVAGIILAMVFLQVVRSRLETLAPWPAFYGSTAGFATTVANAAGPVMSLYLLARRLPKEEFIATGAWFFLVVNLTKLPIYAAQPLWDGPQMITGASLLLDACLLPAVFAGAYAGRRLIGRIPQRWFERAVLGLAIVGALMLLH